MTGLKNILKAPDNQVSVNLATEAYRNVLGDFIILFPRTIFLNTEVDLCSIEKVLL